MKLSTWGCPSALLTPGLGSRGTSNASFSPSQVTSYQATFIHNILWYGFQKYKLVFWPTEIGGRIDSRGSWSSYLDTYWDIGSRAIGACPSIRSTVAVQSLLYWTGHSIWTCQTQWMSSGGANSRSFAMLVEFLAKKGIQYFSKDRKNNVKVKSITRSTLVSVEGLL